MVQPNPTQPNHNPDPEPGAAADPAGGGGGRSQCPRFGFAPPLKPSLLQIPPLAAQSGPAGGSLKQHSHPSFAALIANRGRTRRALLCLLVRTEPSKGGTRWVPHPPLPHLTLPALRMGRPHSGPPSFHPSSERTKLSSDGPRSRRPNAFLPDLHKEKGLRRERGQETHRGGAESTASPCRGAEPRPGGQHGEQPGGQRAERRGEGGAAEPPLRADGSTHGIPAAPPAVGRGSGAGSPWLHLQSLEGSEARAEQSCWLGRLCPHRPVPVPPSHRPHRPPLPSAHPVPLSYRGRAGV